jgi:hypothetical protein
LVGRDRRARRRRCRTRRSLLNEKCNHARHISRLSRAERDGLWLVAHKEINHAIVNELPAAVHPRLERAIPRDLVKAPQRRLLAALKPKPAVPAADSV